MAGRGFALVRFHEGKPAANVRRLGRMAAMEGWPGGRATGAVRITTVFGKRRFDAMVQLRAADRRGLRRICQFMEDNFSHVEGFEL